MPSLSSKKTYTYKHRGKAFPTLGASIWLHDRALELAGELSGIKDEGALLSALEAPIRSAGGEDTYFTFFDKVAALGFLIARNHPFTARVEWLLSHLVRRDTSDGHKFARCWLPRDERLASRTSTSL
jgi:hypothetical protein